jgi:hypothetical protein
LEAKQSLAPYGDRATPLLALADFIIDRKNWIWYLNNDDLEN